MGSSPRSRIVVNTAPRGQRPVYKPQAPKREWPKRAFRDVAIVVFTALVTTFLLLLVSGQLHDTTAGNLIVRSPPPMVAPNVAAKPLLEQSLNIRSSPSPPSGRSASSPTPTETATAAAETTEPTDDTTLQAAIDTKLQDNPDLSDITVTISSGIVTVVGTVASDELKAKVEKLVRAVKGVKHVDNQIVVVSGN
jgi:hypothetical protein